MDNKLREKKCPKCQKIMSAHEGGESYWCRDCNESYGTWGDGSLVLPEIEHNSDKLREIEESLSKATPGPWEVDKRNHDVVMSNGMSVTFEMGYDDAHLIANAPEWLRYQQSVIDTYVKTLTVKDDSIKTLDDTIKRLTEERDEALGKLFDAEQTVEHWELNMWEWRDKERHALITERDQVTSLLRQKEEENKRLQSLIRPPAKA